VPFAVYQGDEPAPDSDLQLLLDRWNPEDGAEGALTRLYMYLFLTGECFTMVERSNPVDKLLPNVLWPFSGHNIVPVGDGVRVDHYEVVTNNADTVEFSVPREDVVPVLLPHPRKRFRGLSPFESLRMALDAEREAKSANRDIFRNGMMTDGMLSIRDAAPNQLEQIGDRFRTEHIGHGNRHRLLLVSGEGNYQPLTMTPRDAEFQALDMMTTRDVCKALRIPPMFLADLEHATLRNFDTGYQALWTMALLPKVGRVAAALTQHLAPQFGDDLRVDPDLAAITALQGNQKEQAETYRLLVTSGWDPVAAADYVFGDSVPEGAVGLPIEQTPQEPVRAVHHRRAPRQRALQARQGKQAQADNLDQRRERRLPLVAAQFRAAMQAQADDAIVVAESILGQRAAMPGDEIVEAIFQRLRSGTDLDETMVAVLSTETAAAVADSAEVFGLTIDAGRVDAATRQFVADTAAEMVTAINETTRLGLRGGIAAALEEGTGIQGVREAIRHVMGVDTISAGRVERIAQTELSRAYGFGNMTAMGSAGIEYHEWISSGLPDSRHGPERFRGNGQVVEVGKDFSINGLAAAYPSDPRLPASEACNCHCTTVPTTREAYDAVQAEATT